MRSLFVSKNQSKHLAGANRRRQLKYIGAVRLKKLAISLQSMQSAKRKHRLKIGGLIVASESGH